MENGLVQGGESESRSGSDNFEDASADGNIQATGTMRRRTGRKYHRHTAEQIQDLESFFKDCPHPDDKQRLALSRKLNLEIKQVKFWFQNRRTQMKTQTERHQNLMLKQENEKLSVENASMREALSNTMCNNCGGSASVGDISYDTQHLRFENTRLKGELIRVSAIADKFMSRQISVYSSQNPGLDLGVGNESHMVEKQPSEKAMLFKLAMAAVGELVKKAQINDNNLLLMMRGTDGELEISNRQEYMRTVIGTKPSGYVTEATMATCVLNVKSLALVETLMDADRWAAMFPGFIATARTTEVILPGMNGTRNGALQLMHAELHVLSPLVPVRLVRFLRFCKQHADGLWTVVDMSIDNLQEPSSYYSCRRLPSGCIVQDMPNGCTQVIWVEHSDYDESAIHSIYQQLIRSGMGYGAQRWVSTLQRQCECLSILTSPIEDDSSLTPDGKLNMLSLSQSMVDNFCSGICDSPSQKWQKLHAENLDTDVKVKARMSETSSSGGVVLSASTSVWIPVSMRHLFDFLRDVRVRSQWDILSTESVAMQEMLRIAKGHYQGNCVSILHANTTSTSQSSMLILQETWIDASASLIVYAPVDLQSIGSVMNGGDLSYLTLLPSGFTIVPDYNHRITPETGVHEGNDQVSDGSLLTVGFQILVNNLPSSKLTTESVETVNNLISCTIQKIKAALICT